MNEWNDEMFLPWYIPTEALSGHIFNIERVQKPFLTLFLPGSRYTCKSCTCWNNSFAIFSIYSGNFCFGKGYTYTFTQYDFLSSKQTKHVKCSKYSNCSGEILFLSAFWFCYGSWCEHYICFVCHSYNIFFFISFSFNSFLGKHNLDAMTGKNYGEFPLNKTYNPNNFTVKQTFWIYIIKWLAKNRELFTHSLIPSLTRLLGKSLACMENHQEHRIMRKRTKKEW